MEFGWIYHVSDHYNSYDYLGLYVVTKAGKQFWTLVPIETKSMQEPQLLSDPAYWRLSGKRIATKPIVKLDGGKKLLVSFDNFNPKDQSATTSSRGSGCYKSFKRVLPDKNNDYVYLATSEHYG